MDRNECVLAVSTQTQRRNKKKEIKITSRQSLIAQKMKPDNMSTAGKITQRQTVGTDWWSTNRLVQKSGNHKGRRWQTEIDRRKARGWNAREANMWRVELRRVGRDKTTTLKPQTLTVALAALRGGTTDRRRSKESGILNRNMESRRYSKGQRSENHSQDPL